MQAVMGDLAHQNPSSNYQQNWPKLGCFAFLSLTGFLKKDKPVTH